MEASAGAHPGSAQDGGKTEAADATPQITTDVVQRYLEENELLIKAIVENQNVGRLNECIKYQEKLQTNIIFLSALAERQVAVMQKEADAAAEAGPAGAEVAGGPGEG